MFSCQRALKWVNQRLKDGVDPDDYRIVEAAAAMAKYLVFCTGLADEVSFKAGDVTVNKDSSGQLELQLRLLENSLAGFCDILKDGGFYFAAS